MAPGKSGVHAHGEGPEIEPRSTALQADSLPAEPPGSLLAFKQKLKCLYTLNEMPIQWWRKGDIWCRPKTHRGQKSSDMALLSICSSHVWLFQL